MKDKPCTPLSVLVLILFTSVINFSIAAKGWRLHKKIRSINNGTPISSQHLQRLRHHPRYKRDEKLTVCDTCRLTSYDTPFYCSIQPDLPQCIFPNCPKVCDEIGGDPSVQLRPLPPPPPKRPPYPHPYDMPKIPDGLTEQFVKYRPPPITPKSGTTAKAKSSKLPEEFPPYNPSTCEFPSTSLRRIRPGSKYIEYRPEKLSYQISDIHKIASQFGLVLAEFRHPMEWYSVEKSSVLESVSTYKLTADHPKRFYVVGLSDVGGGEPGKFLYKSDKTNPTFAVFDPRIYGRIDEQCGILTHVMGSDKRQYLTIRFWNCDEFMGGKRVVFGLFMFPPGSLCYRRSQEECGKLKQEESGGDAVYHNTIQIGQTLARFIYLYTDQRSWEDAFATCEAKGLHMLDFDSKWDDALRTVEVIEHFLREARLNPVTTFWTAGRFEKMFSDGRFMWATTGNVFESHYEDEAPFAFSWWDDQKVSQYVSSLSRRSKMKPPCVSVALNPETRGERPKINFKSWYCDFPMYVLCYKKINATDSLDNPVPEPTTARRSSAHPESCEKPPGPKPGDGKPATGPPDEENIDPFNEESCTSTSKTVKRLTPNSKFVDYQPISSSYSAEEIKERCKKYGLLPAEVRTREDWDSIEKSGIDGVVSGDESNSAAFFYVIGMDDSKEHGKLMYDSGGNITFSMFSAEGNNDIANRCSILNSVQVPGLPTRGLMMQHVNCQEGKSSSEKIAYGLCMFPPNWKCFRESTEELATTADINKFNTIFPLGVTDKRTIFFSPVQRTREDAWKFTVAANLTLLDFDPKWGDAIQVMKIFKTKLVKGGGFFQLTPFWTSGKLKGLYKEKTGIWETTKTSITFDEGSSFKWTHLDNQNNPNMREMQIEDGCVEATFYNSESVVKFRPHYCYIPKYFLMYRLHKRRGDPPASNHLGITIIETASRGTEPRSNPLTILAKRIKLPTADKEPASASTDKKSVPPLQKKRDIGRDIGDEHTTNELETANLNGILESSMDEHSTNELETENLKDTLESSMDEHTTNELQDVNVKGTLGSNVETHESFGFSNAFYPRNSDKENYQENQIISSTKTPIPHQTDNSSEYYYEYYYESSSSSQENVGEIIKPGSAIVPTVTTKAPPYLEKLNLGDRLVPFGKGVARDVNNYQDKLIIVSSTMPPVLKGVTNSSEYEYYYVYESSSDSKEDEKREQKIYDKPINNYKKLHK